jgi:GH15 family glucan-1,4-alpha-glucosidase
MRTLDLAVIGNANVSALVDAQGTIVWSCLPRPDGDPVFCGLLDDRPTADGSFAVELVDGVRSEQEYLNNTAILVTRLFDPRGGAVEVVDFAPCFPLHGRRFRPMTFVRRIRPLAGNPRIVLRCRPRTDYGARPAEVLRGSSHVRYLLDGQVLRLTTDASLTALVEERPFHVRAPLAMILGPDETLLGAPGEIAARFFDETRAHWHDWVRALAIPFEWQEPVIRAAITLKLSTYDDTGAILAATTTSIPEAADSGRNWDYRYCWWRDASFVVAALNRLSATRTMERYLDYLLDVAATQENGRLQPVYALDGASQLDERHVTSLPGYRGMGPVRVGNAAWSQAQHDVYGAAILAAAHVFFDRRLARIGDEALFRRLEPLGRLAVQLHDQPDAGLWELRGRTHVHTYSSVLCWAACDRLARIATHLGLEAEARGWRQYADAIHRTVCARAWSARRQVFAATFDGDTLDASLLLLHELGFLPADDARFRATVDVIGRELKRGNFVFRYDQPDDFGAPTNAFVVCTFWYADALAALGRGDEARELFEAMLACRNRHGLLAEHVDPRTREAWGNFPQTYSMVGLINSAMRLSLPWHQAF